MSSKYNIPDEFQNDLKIQSDRKGIQLPYPAPTIYWRNGDIALADMDEIKDARRFGGWGVGKDELDELRIMPAPTWKLFENLRNAKGATFSAYLFRTVWVAKIDRRIRWEEVQRDNGTTSAKSTMNTLVYLATRDNQGKFVPYGAAVLKGQSYTGKAIDDAFKHFAELTAQLRGNALPNLFFTPIGTWGDKVVTKSNTSKDGKNSSVVTDPILYVPDGGYTEKFLDDCFVPNVGSDILAQMRDYRKQAKECGWLNEWDKPQKQDPNAAFSASEPANDDEFPFG